MRLMPMAISTNAFLRCAMLGTRSKKGRNRMHNIWKRLTVGCLAALMMLSFSACNRGGGEGGGETLKIVPLEGETPVDLGGETFTVVDFSDARWNRENNGTPYYDAWQKVLDEVETLYNCKIELNVSTVEEMFVRIQPEVMAGGKYADIVVQPSGVSAS